MAMADNMSSRSGLAGTHPGLTVVVPSTPADAGGLIFAALQHDGPVIFLEHKLLSETYLEFLDQGASDGPLRRPREGARGPVPRTWSPSPSARPSFVAKEPI